jgi:hypothetical protein
VIVLQVVSVFIVFNGCNNPVNVAVTIKQRTSNFGPSEEELRANRNVKKKKTQCWQKLSGEDPFTGG